LLAVPRTVGRFFQNSSPSSLYTRYPWTRHIVVLFIAMLVVDSLSSPELGGLRSTAMRRGQNAAKSTKIDEAFQNLKEEQNDDNIDVVVPESFTSSSLKLLQNSFQTILFGQNAWTVVSKINFMIGGWRVIAIPLLMYSKTEEALKGLGFPPQMISLRAASLLDNGMAKKISLVWMCAWAYFIWFVV